MSVGLSAAELAQLQAALTTLLSPLAFEHVGVWRTKARHAVQALLGADRSVSLLQIRGEPPFEADELTPLVEYGAYYHQFDRVNKYRDLGTVAFTWDTISHLWERPSRSAWLRSEFYNDWVCRHRLCQPRGLNLALPPGQPLVGPPQGEDVAALYFYQNAERPVIDGERQRVLLETLLPAFSAGVYMAQRVGERRMLGEVLDALAEGTVLVDEAGGVVYENAAFRDLLAEDPEAGAVGRQCVRAARLLHALSARRGTKTSTAELEQPTAGEVHTGTAAYRLNACLLGVGVLTPAPVALVVLERTSVGPKSLERFRQRYRLTHQELAVSRLLADGRSNADLARDLAISVHTARRHVEHVLMKLGVHSRAAVGAALRGNDARRSA